LLLVSRAPGYARRMDSEAETEHEWSENESDTSVHDVREARVHQFSANHDAREDEDPRRQGAEHGRVGHADGPGAERLDGAEGAEERVVDGADGPPVGLVRVVEPPVAGRAHGGGRASGGATITIELAGRRPPDAAG